MRKRSDLADLGAVAAWCAVLATCVLGCGAMPGLGQRPGSKHATAVPAKDARLDGDGWFLLDPGLGHEGLPILFRLDGGVVSEIVSWP
ncbi:MAG TPA: hypothetical protein VF628_12010 [Allosphingosinicella sp.]|jgi:hypothetical protein